MLNGCRKGCCVFQLFPSEFTKPRGNGGAGLTSVTRVVVVPPNRDKAHVTVYIVDTVSETPGNGVEGGARWELRKWDRGRLLGLANTVLWYSSQSRINVS